MNSLLSPKPRTRDYILDDSDILKVKRSIKTFTEALLVLGLLYTGMRVSEFIHFRESWVDWKKGLITIPRQQTCYCYSCKRTLKNRKGQIVKPSGVWKPKTEESIRPIPVLPEVEKLFMEYFKRHDAVMDVIGSRVYAWMVLKRVEERSGVKLFPHVLRGTFATLLASKGFDATEITPLLGWKSFKMADQYIKFSGARVLRAVKEKWRPRSEA